MDMANVRITDQTTDTALQSGDYVIVDSQNEGTRKFDLGSELSEIKQDLQALEDGGMGVSDELKYALLQIASKVSYEDGDGADYYDALESALFPAGNLSYITCVYTQSTPIFTTTDLNALKSDLVVTAHYSDNTTDVVTHYLLTGTLTAGESTITVNYQNKTTTFTVEVSARYYLTSSGTQYINTGINFTFGQKLEIDGKGFCYDTVTSPQWYFGAYDGSSNIIGIYSVAGATLGNGTRLFPRINPVSQRLNDMYITPDPSTRYKIALVENKYYVDDVLIATTQATSSYAMSIPIYLFGRDNAGNADGLATNLTIYGFKIYDERDILIHDFVPMLDDEDTPCLYDTITDTYKYNAGSGTFSYGEAT